MDSSIHDVETQNKILSEIIFKVPTYGWTLECLEHAVLELGLTKQDAKRAFQGNLDYVFDHLMATIEGQMVNSLKSIDLTTYRIRDRIIFLITLRLNLMSPYRLILTKAIKHQLKSGSVKNLSQKFLTTVSNIWYTAGDQATDFNYYSKRFLLSGVYGATFLFWLRDTSVDFVKTQKFLQKRIDHVMAFSSWIRRFKS